MAFTAKCSKGGTDALLECEQVTLGEGIRLGNNGDKIDTGTETLHDFNIERLEARRASDGTPR
jgi:hypothetical protein